MFFEVNCVKKKGYFLVLCFCLSVSVALCFFESNKVNTAWNVFNVMYGENPELLPFLDVILDFPISSIIIGV